MLYTLISPNISEMCMGLSKPLRHHIRLNLLGVRINAEAINPKTGVYGVQGYRGNLGGWCGGKCFN
jgi:hypothetical protein